MMQRFGAFVLLGWFGLTTSVRAEAAKLTTEEITAGWILLFDGETTFGWSIGAGGKAEIKDGSLVLSGKNAATTNTAFGEFELSLETNVDDADVSPVLRLADPWKKEDSTLVALRPYKPGEKGAKQFYYRVEGGQRQLKITAPNGSMTAYPAEPWKGPKVVTIGFGAKDGQTFSVKNLKLRPLGEKPIFNGKDLTGWKEIPGRKSKFSVTAEGWLNVKNGNGDLHSTDEWDDFVLQMEIISNGSHLNSGVFYRSIANEFWSGYESQIRNEWVTDVVLKDGTTVTGSVTESGDTVKVLPTSKANAEGTNFRTKGSKTFKKDEVAELKHHRDMPVDIGTGGIYNRQPARKVVSTDHEWFTKTLVVHSNHMAVWINGYQVSDFTDTASISNSARKGRKDDKGPLSIQGHDPTTDLSFRNIRLATLPRP